MAENVTPIAGSATLNTAPWRAGLTRLRRDTTTFRNSLTTEFSRINASIAQPTDQVKKLGIGLKDLGRITSGIVVSQVFYRGLNAIREMRDEVINFTFEMERLEQSFTRMFANRTDAKVMIDIISELAAKTDLSITGALKQARSLQAMGFEAEYVYDILSVLNDQIAFMGGDLDQMDRITYALGQIRNSAKLGGQEVKQLVNAFVPVGRYLQEAFPQITDDQLKNIADIGIGGKTAVKAIVEGMRRDTEGMAAILAQTSKGLINNLKEQALLVSNRLVEGLRDGWRKAVLKPISDLFQQVGDVARVGGIGAVLDTFFSPRNAKNIRLIAAGLYQGVRALVRWGSAMKPVAKSLLELTGTVLAILIPALNTLSYWLGTVTQFFINTLPPVRLLFVALGSLFIANAVAKSFLFLWGVLRLGTVLYTVTTGIIKLYAGLRLLMVALKGIVLSVAVTTPGLVMLATKFGLIAGAVVLLVIAFRPLIRKLWEFIASSKWAAIAANELTYVMRKLGLVDLSNMLLDTSATKDMEAYNAAVAKLTQRLGGISDEERKIGAEAEKAGRRILASFDEVFEIPKADDNALDLDTSNVVDAMAEMKKIMEDLFPKDKGIEIVPPVGGWEGWKKWALGLGTALALWVGRRLIKRLLIAIAGAFLGNKPPDDPGGSGGVREAKGGEGTYWDPSMDAIAAANEAKEKATEETLDRVWRRTKEGWAQINQEVALALALQLADIIMNSNKVKEALKTAYTTAANEVTFQLARIREALRAIPVSHVITIGLVTGAVLVTLAAIKAGILAIPVLTTIAVVLLATAGIVGLLNDIAVAAKDIPSEVNVKVNVNATEANKVLSGFKDALGKLANVKIPVPTIEKAKEPIAAVSPVSDFLQSKLDASRKPYVATPKPAVDPKTIEILKRGGSLPLDQLLIDKLSGATYDGLDKALDAEIQKLKLAGVSISAAGVLTAAGTGLAAISASGGASLLPALAKLMEKFEALRNLNNLEAIPGFARGGIVTRDSVFRAGEGNKKEAIVPLERTGVISEFARSIAEEMGMGQQKVSHYHIGTLIADDRSLTEFERRLYAIRIDENTRTGGA